MLSDRERDEWETMLRKCAETQPKSHSGSRFGFKWEPLWFKWGPRWFSFTASESAGRSSAAG
jgi:hypothetical protein